MRHAALIPRPGARLGPCPERTSSHAPWPLFWAELIRVRMHAACTPSATRQTRFLRMVHAQREKMRGCSTEFIAARARRLRTRFILEGLEESLIAEVFALIDACLQAHCHIRLHDPQLVAGWLMLDRRLIEMETGEGKTLAVALAAATGALAGIPVHVLTANDYLVERDAASLKPVFASLGLTVGAVTANTATGDRPQIYCSDITYCTAREVAFDYMRDQLAKPDTQSAVASGAMPRNLRGLRMAIVDEADSVLIDEARMPLVLSQPEPDRAQAAFYRQALFLAAQLNSNEDYFLDHHFRTARLTAGGRVRLQHLTSSMGEHWHARRTREEVICLALAANHLFMKDRHYLVRDQKIVIIDDTTGRQAHGRVWSQGLHQLIEAKERCPLAQVPQIAAQITFQRFFPRYLCLSGISGTLSEAASQLLAIYELPVAQVTPRLSSRRIMMPARMFLNKRYQWQYVVRKVSALRGQGRPILVGTDSVSDSEALSVQLALAGIPHAVLNARLDHDEARIIASAGQAGMVTVSTNMAGRGTDIALGEGVAASGGLHVIACQYNPSRRIDRQLYGRCGRQGDPGSVEHLYSLDSVFPRLPVSAERIAELARFIFPSGELPGCLSLFARFVQRKREARRRTEHWFLFLNDGLVNQRFAFAGRNQ
jgi:preprotein translocase subunit SecA